MDNLNSKKFILAILFSAIGVVLVLLDKVTGDSFLLQLAGIFGLYVTANVAENKIPDALSTSQQVEIQKSQAVAVIDPS